MLTNTVLLIYFFLQNISLTTLNIGLDLVGCQGPGGVPAVSPGGQRRGEGLDPGHLPRPSRGRCSLPVPSGRGRRGQANQVIPKASSLTNQIGPCLRQAISSLLGPSSIQSSGLHSLGPIRLFLGPGLRQSDFLPGM